MILNFLTEETALKNNLNACLELLEKIQKNKASQEPPKESEDIGYLADVINFINVEEDETVLVRMRMKNKHYVILATLLKLLKENE